MLRSFLRILPLTLLPALAFAQGTLDPSGAPAPAMKTLDQIEPRIPLRAGAPGVTQEANGGFTISASGSYYLEGNLTVTSETAISLNKGDVTLDLNGFTITTLGGHAAISGMATEGDIVIRNGRIVGSTTYDLGTKTFTRKGTRFGIIFSPFIGTCTISDITVRGINETGIWIYSFDWTPQRTSVRHCTVSVCGDQGIIAGTITDSTAETCRNTALSALTVSNSVGISVGIGSGIRANTVTNSYGQSQSAFGIVARIDDAAPLGNATNCRGVSVTGTGLFATAATNCIGSSKDSGTGLVAETATGCSGDGDSGTGLFADNAANCRGTSYFGTGLFATAATNCRGTSTSGTGLDTNSESNGYTGTATGCVGRSTSGHGLIASVATNCTGITTDKSKIAVWVSGTATGCRGTNTGATGTGTQSAITSTIAVACTATTGTINTGSKQLGTP